MPITVTTRITNTASARMIRMMKVVHDVSSRSTQDIASKQAMELSRFLAKRCGEIAPSASALNATAQRLGYRLRRPSDSQRGTRSTSIETELRARKASRKYVGACWLQMRNVYQGKNRTKIIKPVTRVRGEVQVKWPSGPFQKGYILLINKARNKRLGEFIASQVHARYGILDKALNDTTRNMIPYIRRKRAEMVKEIKFS